jgi:hypothetical protein
MLSWLHLHARRPRPSRLTPLPPGIDEAIVRAMSIEPSARPPGPRELLAELRTAVAGPAAPATAARAVSVHVEVAADPATLIAPDDGQVAALAAALAKAASELGGRGFRRAFETGTSALFVRELAGGEPEPAAVAAADEAARALGPPLETRVRAGPLADLLRLDWV